MTELAYNVISPELQLVQTRRRAIGGMAEAVMLQRENQRRMREWRLQ